MSKTYELSARMINTIFGAVNSFSVDVIDTDTRETVAAILFAHQCDDENDEPNDATLRIEIIHIDNAKLYRLNDMTLIAKVITTMSDRLAELSKTDDAEFYESYSDIFADEAPPVTFTV